VSFKRGERREGSSKNRTTEPVLGSPPSFQWKRRREALI
jgi:hypothetical protein